MEWMVHEIRPRYHAADWSARPLVAENTTLELELRPITREISGRKYTGFSYRYHYSSDEVPIYKILDRGTWEIGGSAIAQEFWMRNCFVAPIQLIESAKQFYSSEWYVPDCANPSVFQFLPLQTELQGFTFTASKAGVLVTWATQVAHIRSLFEKPRGKDLLVHFHEHCGDLAHEFVTAPMEVLWCPGERSRVDLANDYHEMHELVHETLHREIGMRRERVTTYGQIEEWGPADIDRYRQLGLPKLLKAGVKTIFLSNHFENNMNTWGVGNMCCTIDLKIAESVGQDKLRSFCQAAREGGAKVEMWGNTAISALTTIFNYRNGTSDRIRFLPSGNTILDAIDSKTGFARNPSNAIEADHYAPVFAVLNLRDAAVRNYWMRQWKAAHEEVGLGGIFLDSSFNLSSDKFHYVQNAEAGRFGATADQIHLLGNFRPENEPAQAILSQYQDHLSLMVAMQQAGYVYCNEDLGVFGIHRHGPGVQMRLTNLFLWADCIATFDSLVVKAAGLEADDVFFQGLAYRMIWSLHWDISRDALSFHFEGLRGDHDAPSEWQLAALRAYDFVETFMRSRTILPEEAGVLYRDGDRQVLWAFKDFVLPLEHAASVTDILGGQGVETAQIEASRNHVYLISTR
jgi:hypothetical protein